MILEEVWLGDSVKVADDLVWEYFHDQHPCLKSKEMVQFVLELKRLHEEKRCLYLRPVLFFLEHF